MNYSKIKIVECPRDAMQGIHDFIDTKKKIKYINSLLKVGFDTIDVGSFVSAKAIPQMQDTVAVLKGIDMLGTSSKLLTIIANKRGAQEAVSFDCISYLGFPFSISETFQLRNTNSTILQSLDRVKEIQELCVKNKKEMVVYISMAFGNPYGDPWNSDIAIEWTEKLSDLGIRIFSMADTIGVSNPDNITYLFKNIIPKFPHLEIGAHLHTTPERWKEKVEAAYNNGCFRFDGAIKGFGGCPMAADELVGNMPTEKIIDFFIDQKIDLRISEISFKESMIEASLVFPLI